MSVNSNRFWGLSSTRRRSKSKSSRWERLTGRRTNSSIERLEDRLLLANQPDLLVTALSAPASAIVGDANKITISWTVKNQGDVPATGDWNDRVILSDDAQGAGNAVTLASDSVRIFAPLAPNDTYTVTRTLTVPNTATGNRFLVVRTDGFGDVTEADESNNVSAQSIMLAGPGAVDLAVTAASLSSSTAAAGQGAQVGVTWTIANQGSIPASADWNDGVYLSTDNLLDVGTDTFLTSASEAALTPLAAGGAITRLQNVTIPNVPAGSYFLLVKADTNNSQNETNESNNVSPLAITLTHPGNVDLAISNPMAPGSVTVGENATIDVSWTVANPGTVAAASDWRDAVYLSTDNVYDAGDRQLYFDFGSHPRPLPGGQSYTTHDTLSVPNVTPGSYFLIFRADDDDDQAETNAANNDAVLPITLNSPGAVDLSLTSASGPASAVVNGATINVSWTVQNLGSAAANAQWNDAVYISSQPIFDFNATFLTSLTANNGVPLAGGGSYMVSSNVQIPDIAAGDMYLLFRTDSSNDQAETDETNNVLSRPITITRPDVNLEVTATSSPANATIGAGQFLNLSWTVHNAGSAAGMGGWNDYVYLSDDPFLNSGDEFLDSGDGPPAGMLAAGASYTNVTTVTLENTAPGARYLLFITDYFADQAETREWDNIVAVPIALATPAADLTVTGVTSPASAVAGNDATINVTWSVTNQGAAAAAGFWSDYVLLSDDPTLDSSDVYLTDESASPLGPGASKTFNNTLTIPNATAGSKYLLFAADRFNEQGESNESNNVVARPITITAPEVDLTVTTASGPASAVEGSMVALSWTVQNTGSQTADANWTDRVYISDYPFLDSRASFLTGNVQVTSQAGPASLAAGASYMRNVNVTIPQTAVGNRYLLFVTDADNRQSETLESNNVFISPITLTAPNLVPTALTAPATATVNDTISVSWTVANQGSEAAPAAWTDAIYVSDVPTFDFRARFLDSFAAPAPPLGAGASYNRTQMVSLDAFNITAGAKYLLLVTDTNEQQGETNENDNVRAVPITLNAPDLRVTAATAPSTALSGDTVGVTFTVENQGAFPALGNWSDYVYFSLDNQYDFNDTFLDSFFGSHSPLAAGASYTVTDDLSLGNAPLGNGFLLFVTDGSQGQGETDENNNVFATPISLNGPDLTVTSVTAPSSGILSQTVSVTYTVQNVGSFAAPADWNDYVYASDDQIFDSGDTVVASIFAGGQTPLAPGASYTLTQNITLPNTGTGARYLLFVADRFQDQNETDENNNVRSSAITLSAPDLTVTAATAPMTLVVGSQATVSYTVQNQGAVQAPASWTDYIYLSDDQTLDSGDTFVQNVSTTGNTPLAAGASYTLNPAITLPSSSILGSKFLLFAADRFNGQGETDETNNVRAVAVTVTAPDLTVSSATLPTTAEVGNNQSVALMWTVTNQGSVTADANWSDYVYVSDDQTLDNNDTLLTGVFQGGRSPLAPGANYMESLNVVMPNTAAGSRYLLVVTDRFNDQGETDENNNVFSQAITLTTPAVDLVPSAPSAPDPVTVSGSAAISFTITNSGGQAAGGSWNDYVYLSSDETLDDSDTLVTTYFHNGLAAGANYTNSSTVTVPYRPLGSQFWLFVTDRNNNQAENNENNNVVSKAVTINGPDLEVTASTSPASALLNQTIAVSWTVTNQGSVPALADWYDAVYISSDTTFDFNDTYVGQYYQGSLSPLAPGASYTFPQNINIPSTAAGDRYLLFRADHYDYQSETDENNNTRAVAIHLSEPDADLVVSSATTPSTGIVGETVSISYTVANQGTAVAGADWVDHIYLSDDAFLDFTDQFLTSVSAAGDSPLADGDDYTKTGVNITLSGSRATPGAHYLLIITDANQQQRETDNSNNLLAQAITLSAPDLTVSAATAPATATLGATIAVTWTVLNQGSVLAPADWTDAIYLSNDTTLDGSDTAVASYFQGSQSPLAAGADYPESRNIVLPSSAIGSRYLLFVTDDFNSQGETDENNNTRAVAIDIQAPDLEVTASTGPAAAALGDTVQVTWTTKNQGAVPTAATWRDRIYVSSNTQLDGGDTLVADFDQSARAPSAPGAEYNEARDVVIPNTATGARFLLFVTDATGQQPETDEVNNVRAVPITLSFIDLVADALTAPAAAQFGQTINVSWTVRNAGSDDANQTWNDRIYLSTDNSLDGGDAILATVDASSVIPVASGATYTRNASVTLPLNANTVDGTYYLIVRADDNNQVIELNNANNITSQAVDLEVPPLPDLVVSALMTPSSGLTGQDFLVTWTDTNQGTLSAGGNWVDRVYVNLEGAPGLGTLLGEFPLSGPLAPGASVERTQRFTFPGGPGNYHVRVIVDAAEQVLEGPGDLNNATLTASPINVLQAPLPDLVVTNVVVPPDGVLSGDNVQITFTVMNQGTAPTQAPFWKDYVFVSQDPDIEFEGYIDTLSDQIITNQPFRAVGFQNPGYLDVGQSYTQTVTVRLLKDRIGPFYVYIVADGIGFHFSPAPAVTELREDNNLTRSLASFNIDPAPAPDLQIARVQAPEQAFSGQFMNLSWTVVNNGLAPAASDGNHHLDQIYMSSDTTLDAQDFYLGFADYSYLEDAYPAPALPIGASYHRTMSVVLPTGVGGAFYFLIATDASDEVFEGVNDDNNLGYDLTATTVNLTPPPDLEVPSVSSAATALAGHKLPVQFTLANNGSTAPPQGQWSVAFYLSADTQLDASDTLLDTRTHYGQLAPGQSVNESQTLTLPNGISGLFHILVFNDSADGVFELNNSNNVGASPALQIDSRPADLVVSSVGASATVLAGQAILVNWTVANQGTGDSISTAWSDKVYLSTSPTFGPDAIKVGSFTHFGLLNAGDSYQQSQLVTIPFTLVGQYNLFIKSDAEVVFGEGLPSAGPNGLVYEASNEGNNVSTALPITVTRATPDLQVTSVTAPASGVTGQAIMLSWSVKNFGVGRTNRESWYDDVYLSTDALAGPDDRYLGSLFHSGGLDAQAQYDAAATFALPHDLAAGDYRLIVRTDRPVARVANDPYVNRVLESDETNNDRAGSLTSVTLAPTPDLVTSAVGAPNSANAGQSIHVSWSVNNNGAAPALAHWFDHVYLSVDQILDRNVDRPLGGMRRTTNLAAGENYISEGDFQLPLGLTGSYYVLVGADVGNMVYERGAEANNVAAAALLQIGLAAPTDLVAGAITVPANATPGAQISLTYNVHNGSAQDATGDWTDTLYLSTDDVWDAGDARLGQVVHRGGLLAGMDYSEVLNATLPGVAPGDYKVILRTDARNQVAEANETNNLSASLNAVDLDVPALTLGVAATGALGFRSVYYKVAVPAGETLQIALDSSTNLGFNELYASFETLPTRSQAEFRFDRPLAPDQRVTVPNTQAGEYYVLVVLQGSGAPADQYSLTAELVPFSVQNVAPETAGNAGQATLEIHGARFNRDTTFTLRDAQQNVVQATATRVQDQSVAFVTFDLTGRPAGAYDIVALGASNATATLAGGLTVVQGQGADLKTSLQGPQFVLHGRNSSLEVVYSNEGDSDAIAPLFAIDTPTNTAMSLEAGRMDTDLNLVFLGAANDGPAGVLRPGESYHRTVYFTAPGLGEDYEFNLQVYTADDPDPIDWDIAGHWILPDWRTDPNWSAIYARLQQQIGDTWGDFVRMLARNASLVTPAQGDPRNLFPLLNVELSKAAAATGTSLTGIIEAQDPSLAVGGRLVTAFDQSARRTVITHSYADGTFIFDRLEPGDYQFRVQDGLLENPPTVSVSPEQRIADVALTLTVGGEISGRVVTQEDGTPIEGARLIASGPDGRSFIAKSDREGRYSIQGLPAGDYRIAVDAPGRARDARSGVAVATTRVPLSIALAIGATVQGSVSLLPGGPPATDLIVTAQAAGTIDAGHRFGARVDGDTIFALGGMPGGIYDITIRMPGYLTRTLSGVVIAAGGTVDLGVTSLTPAASVSGLFTSFDPTVSVVDVQLGVFDDQGFLVATTATDGTGQFRFDDLAAGMYSVGIADGSGFTQPAEVTLIAGQQANGLSVVLQPGGSIAGVVTDAVTQMPVAGLTVSLAQAGGVLATTTTDESGAYRFDQLNLGAYTVYLNHAAHGPAGSGQATISSLQGSAVQVDLQLSVQARVKGTLRTAGGAAISGGTVELLQAGHVVASAATAEDGSYEFLLLDPGAFDLAASATGFSFTPALSVAVAQGATVMQDFTAGAGALTVMLSDGVQTTAGVRVLLRQQTHEGLAFVASKVAGPDGTVTFTDLVDGDYSLLALSENDRGASEDVSLTDGEGEETIVLVQRGSLTGHITDDADQPLAGVVVSLVSTSDPSLGRVAITDANGDYEIHHAPFGEYDLLAYLPGYSTFTQTGLNVTGDLSQDISLTPQVADIRGRVLDSLGNPAPGLLVNVIDSQGRIVAQGQTGDDGEYVVEGGSGSGLRVQVMFCGQPVNGPITFNHPPGSATDVNVPDIQLPFTWGAATIARLTQLPRLPAARPQRLLENAVTEVEFEMEAESETLDVEPEDCPPCDALLALAQILAEDQYKLSAELSITATVLVGDLKKGQSIFMQETVRFLKQLRDLAEAEKQAAVALYTQFCQVGPIETGLKRLSQDFKTVLDALVAVQSAITEEGLEEALEAFDEACEGALETIEELLEQWRHRLMDEAPGAIGAVERLLDKFEHAAEFLGGPQFAQFKAFLTTLEEVEVEFKIGAWVQSDFFEIAEEVIEAYEECVAQHEADDTCHPKPKPRPNPPPPKLPPKPPGGNGGGNANGQGGGAKDPNDILGPEGFGDERYVRVQQKLDYTVRFENQPSATAPAQRVVITNNLDADLDWRSFRLGDFGWGDLRFSPPENSAFYQATIEAIDSSYVVNVTATIDVLSGTATWIFDTIDPVTGEAPLDGRIGFLPPNTDAGIGEGFVNYSLYPNATAQTGDRIDAQATIVFDIEPPLDTPQIFNTIDASGPTSGIVALPGLALTRAFTVAWTPGADDSSGSAVQDYNVYVSDNGGPFTLFLENTTSTQAVFQGVPGHTYTFYSLARDNAGNLEDPSGAVQTTIHVLNTVASSAAVNFAAVEGQAFNGLVATFIPAGLNGPVGDFSATIDWGDGQSSAGQITADGAGGYRVTGSHTYATDGAYPFVVHITDLANTVTNANGQAQVSDSPLLAVGVPFAATAGAPLTGVVVATFTDTGGPEPLGNYSATIDWGDGTPPSAGTISVAGGVFSVAGNHTYATSGPYTLSITIQSFGGASVNVAGAAAVALTRNGQYVVQVYLDLLGRAVESQGLAYWTGRLDNGEPRDIIARLLTHTDEYFSTIVKPAYRDYLGREADAEGLAYWIAQMQAGLTDERMQAGFIGSPEYYAHVGGTNRLWVEAMYQNLLGRAPDQQGEDYWVDSLDDGASRDLVALGFATSDEREGVIVREDYFKFLGRDASQDEVDYWVAQFRLGFTNEDIVAGFVAADEYYNRHTQ